MAVTINTKPPTHTPGYNEQYFDAISTQYAQTNFRYVCNVLVDGIVTQEKISARPDNNHVFFNPQTVAEASLRGYFDSTIAQISRATNSVKAITVGIEEEYGSTPATYAGSSATYYVWNAAYSSIGYKSFSYSTSSVSKSLTTLSSNKIYYAQKNAFLSWHRGFSTAALYYMIVKAYDSSGSLIKTTQIINNFNGYAPTTANTLIFANCSPTGLQLIKTTNPIDIISETSPGINIVPSTASYYDVYWTTLGGVDSSNNFRIYIQDFCSKYDKVNLSFLNRLGGYDWQVFNRVKRTTFSKKTQEYKKLPFELDSTNNLIYSLEKSDQYTFVTVITNKLVLNTDWLTETQSALLLDLFGSNEIKYEDENGVTYAVNIQDKDYEVKYKKNDKLIQLTVNLEYSYEDIRQRA